VGCTFWKSLSSAGNQTQDRPTRGIVTEPTELLSYTTVNTEWLLYRTLNEYIPLSGTTFWHVACLCYDGVSCLQK
jgi:hypothetical protein